MLGAIAGDIIGSPFEFNSIKDTDFELFGRRSRYTDDSVMTMAVPEAIIAFIDSTDYESSIRLAVSLGGDSDTQACIAGSIAEAFYGMPDYIVTEMAKRLPPDYKTNIIRLAETLAYRCKLEQLKRCWKM